MRAEKNKDQILACTYDNPATMNRECWQDGRMIYSYSAEFLSCKRNFRPAIFMGATVGPWEPGKIFGDKEAMEPKQ